VGAALQFACVCAGPANGFSAGGLLGEVNIDNPAWRIDVADGIFGNGVVVANGGGGAVLVDYFQPATSRHPH
jgi:hypothetical protein